MKRADVLLVLVARMRVALAAAGLAWLLGWQPGVGGRVVAAVFVVTVLVMDAAGSGPEKRLLGGARRRSAGAR
ncbi:hypothetical protein ACIRVF_15810 [Kitasatospora sp. NPDC101157]|uniref:hypothetical protein n=1 Tax=Kitasatospora sp. NPDC101157 TaxID=3364098 RepID=UPI0038173482